MVFVEVVGYCSVQLIIFKLNLFKKMFVNDNFNLDNLILVLGHFLFWPYQNRSTMIEKFFFTEEWLKMFNQY